MFSDPRGSLKCEFKLNGTVTCSNNNRDMSGTYEFIVHSEHGIQLWLNDLFIRRPLIDAGVRSGADAQALRTSIYLLGGRSYSLRLEFCKGKELDKKGMDDPRKVSKKASVELEKTFEELLRKSEAERGNMANRFDSPFAEITDEDIDSLFSE